VSGCDALGRPGAPILKTGLDLKILSPTLFSMMVIVALATTLMTGPLIDRILPAARPSREPAVDGLRGQLPDREAA
jgi:hypothetical protein